MPMNVWLWIIFVLRSKYSRRAKSIPWLLCRQITNQYDTVISARKMSYKVFKSVYIFIIKKNYSPFCWTYRPTSICQKWTDIHRANGWSTTPNITRTTSDIHAEDPSWRCICDIMEIHNTEFNPVFSKKSQWQKYPWEVCNCRHINMICQLCINFT